MNNTLEGMTDLFFIDQLRRNFHTIIRAHAIRIYTALDLTEEDLYEDFGNVEFYNVEGILELLGYDNP